MKFVCRVTSLSILESLFYKTINVKLYKNDVNLIFMKF